MIPNKSNTNNGCTDNTSSNCVVWQGPDLDCINVCNGDTVSDVVARLAQKICECCENPSSTGIDISTVNQKCLIGTYGTANTVQTLLNNIIDKLCTCCENVSSPTDPCSCSIPIPTCLRKAARDYAGNGTSPVSFQLHNDPTLGSGRGYAHFLALQICENIQAITEIQSTLANHETRITYIENNCCHEHGTHGGEFPQSVSAPNSTGNTSVVSVATAVQSIDKEIGNIYQTVGTTNQINTAVAYTPALSQKDRLSGSGTMAATRGWITTPRNLAQSFQNLWITMSDTRNAVENLNETVAKPSCSDITFDVVGAIKRNSENGVLGIELDFQNSIVPSTFTECNSRGTKVVITDSSLNTITKFIPVDIYQNNTPFLIPTSEMGNLDLGSNYSARIEFCASDGVTTCQEIQTITIENELGCPTLNIGSITAAEIPFTVTSIQLPVNKDYLVNVELSNRNGALLDSRSFTYQGRDITGTFSNLTPNTQYEVRVTQTKTGDTHVTKCPVQLVSTTAPVCTTTIRVSSDSTWYTNPATNPLQTGASTITLATYNDGSGTSTKWEVGFDNTNTPIVKQAPTTGVTGWVHNGSFVNDELSIEPLAITGLAGTPLSPGTSGVPIVRVHEESGWKYFGTLTDPNGQLYYVYASVSTNSKNIAQVVFACKCDGLYLDTPQPVYYARRNAVTEITVDAVGYTQGGGTFTWNITKQPSHGSLAFKSGSPTSSKAIYNYTQDNTSMVSDSFVVTLTNDCGTSIGSKYICILPAEEIKYTDSEVVIFFDSNSVNIDNARKIKKSFNAIRSGFSGGTKPTFSYIALNGNVSGDYLKHVKGMVENVGSFASSSNPHGAAISIVGSGDWYTDIMESGATLPASFGASGTFPPHVTVISFVNQVGTSNGTYGKATIPSSAAWTTPNEPTSNGGSGADKYKEDFDAMIDITSSAAPKGSWAIATQGQSNFPWKSGSIPFTVTHIVAPLISGTTNATAAVSLQAVAASQGSTLLTEQEYSGAKFGLYRYANHGAKAPGIDFTKYLLSGASGSLGNIPYSGSTSVSGNTIVGLKDLDPGKYTISVHNYLENWIDFDSATNSDITTYFRGMFGLLPTGSANEPSSPGSQIMGASSTTKYAVETTGSTTEQKVASACNNAKTSSNCITIYNASGVEFKDDEKAYTSRSAAANEQGEYELEDGKFYARCAGTTGVAVAKYNRTAVSGKHWTDNTTCP